MTHEMSEWFLFGLIVLLWVVQSLGQIRDWLMKQILRNLEDRVKRLEAERSPWSAAADEDE